MRDGADAFRRGRMDVPHTALIEMVADWIESEADLWEWMEGFAILVSQAFEKHWGPDARLEVSRNPETGEIKLNADSSENALRIIDAGLSDVSVQPTGGVWVVYDFNYGVQVQSAHRTELEALRVVNGQGYGKVMFLPYDVDAAGAERDHRG